MKELRDIKIDLLMGNQNPIIDLFNQITSGIEIINCHVYDIHGLEFIYHKDGEWIFYQDCKNKNFWCNHMKYWSFFESNLQLGYVEIQAITKYLVEEALKREVNTPCLQSITIHKSVEEALKREVNTPHKRHLPPTNHVEEALKREMASPQTLGMVRPVIDETVSALDQVLKREVKKKQRT